MSEPQDPTDDALATAVAAFQRMSVPDAPPDDAILARLDAELTDRPRTVTNPSSSKRRRFPMGVLIPSAAAAMLLIGGVGFFLLLDGAASIALADVVKAAAKHKLVRYQQQQITDIHEESGAILRSSIHADLTAPRLFSESRVKDLDGGFVTLSVHDGKYHLTTNSRQRTARLDFAPKGYKSLLCCLEDLQQKKGVTQEKDDLEGRPTVKYRHVEGKQTVILWVDAKTKLPLRMEQESIDPSPGVSRTTLVWTDFAWDPELPPGSRNLDELFSTRPPDGYALDDRTRTRKQ